MGIPLLKCSSVFYLLFPMTHTRRLPTGDATFYVGTIRLPPSTTLGFKSWRIHMVHMPNLRRYGTEANYGEPHASLPRAP